MPRLPESIWRRRLENEYSSLKTNKYLSNIEANPDKTEYHFSLNCKGYKKISDSVIPINRHDVSIYLTREYPYAGGIEVIWDSDIFHPNIREKDGVVCIQLLNQWSESQTLSSVVDALVQMIENPNPYSPLNSEAAKYFAKFIPNKTLVGKPRVVL